MSFLDRRPQPEEVFTPRSALVNTNMYVSRERLEDSLKLALRGALHIVIHGESGTGKSWLYKKVLTENKAKFIVSNLANASRLGSIAAELRNIIAREGEATKTGFEEEKSAEINAAVASGSLSHTGKYDIGQKEPFEACLRHLRDMAGKNQAVLVFDNLEAAFTDKLLKELADLLILCDDERYAQYNVRILIVGVPGGIKEYYYKTPHHQTVANRLYEIPEVSRLTTKQSIELLHKGLIEQLKFEVEDWDKIAKHIAWVTDCVPQMLHEYGLELAFSAEKNNNKISPTLTELADLSWFSKSLNHAYAVIEHHMNERDTKAGRRNQVLFSLGFADGEHFKAPEIDTRVRTEFPASTAATTLNVPQTLAQLASGDKPVVKRSPKGDAFSFVDPRYRMVIRAMLRKTAEERVEEVPLSR